LAPRPLSDLSSRSRFRLGAIAPRDCSRNFAIRPTRQWRDDAAGCSLSMDAIAPIAVRQAAVPLR
jgi:hypothetical protein